MWEIEPIEVKVKIKNKKVPERLAESEICKIGLDPCYIIIRQEGVLGESVHEFLYINNSLHKVENTLSPTCEICGRLVVGENNFPYEVSFNTKEEMKNFCDSCIEKYKEWDNYIESKLLFGADSCEDCGKPTNNKVLSGKNIKVQVCEECINGLTNMGFEKTVNSTTHKSASPFPVQIKGKSKRKQIHKLKLTKYLKPYAETEVSSDAPQEIFDELIEQPRKIPQILIKREKAKEEWIKKEEKRKMRTSLIFIGIILLSVIIVMAIYRIYGYYASSEFRQFDGKILYVGEGTGVTNHHDDTKSIGPDVIKIEYNPDSFKDSLLLWSLSGGELIGVKLDEFKIFLNSSSVREATIDEKVYAELCRGKKLESRIVKSVNIYGVTIGEGDLPMRLFRVVRPNESPVTISDPQTNAITSAVHSYVIDGIQYEFVFKRTGPLTFRVDYIVISPNHSLTFKECIKEILGEAK
ncbi:MAG: hypothetical protein WC855_06915 [Thermodesulfovibrionales bacterium]